MLCFIWLLNFFYLFFISFLKLELVWTSSNYLSLIVWINPLICSIAKLFISWLFILFSKLSLIRILFSKLSLIRILLSLFSLISLLFRPAFSSFFLLYLLSLFSLSMIFLFFYIINEEFSSQGYYFYYLIRN